MEARVKFCKAITEMFESGEIDERDVNPDSHIASSPISQSYFFKEVRYLILASSQRKLYGYIEFSKFDVTVKKSNSSKI